MKDILLPLIATREGWAFRQILKGITVACASMTTWLLAQGVDASTSAAIVAGIGSALAWGAEFGLSKLASKIATPCLALACLFLTSCGSTPTGEKTFIGITSAGWLNVGKSAAVAAVPVALDERAKTSAKNPVKVR
jgi:hypothetical protein